MGSEKICLKSLTHRWNPPQLLPQGERGIQDPPQTPPSGFNPAHSIKSVPAALSIRQGGSGGGQPPEKFALNGHVLGNFSRSFWV